MQKSDLVRMANQIAHFFEPYGHEEGVEGVTGHLQNFWDPRMRRQLASIVEAEPELVHELVVHAVGRLVSPEERQQ